MSFLCVMYMDEREVDRWSNLTYLPNPKFWHTLHRCMVKQTNGQITWYKPYDESTNWKKVPEEEIPKKLRLLALLE